MAVLRRVEWTFEAQAELARIHAFVRERWSDAMAERFLDLVMDFEDTVRRFPHAFQPAPFHPELRLGLVHRNVRAIYRVDPDRILIITLLDTRADNSTWW